MSQLRVEMGFVDFPRAIDETHSTFGLAQTGRTSSPDRPYSTHAHGPTESVCPCHVVSVRSMRSACHNHSGAAEGEARVLGAATGAASRSVVREVEVDFRFRRVRL